MLGGGALICKFFIMSGQVLILSEQFFKNQLIHFYKGRHGIIDTIISRKSMRKEESRLATQVQNDATNVSAPGYSIRPRADQGCVNSWQR